MSVETTIKALERQLRDVEQQRARLVEAIRALRELPSANGSDPSAPRQRRTGTSPLVEAALAALRTATKPRAIMELVAAIQRNGVEASRPANKLRASLVSALLRRNDLFVRPSRGVYGLAERGDK